MSDLGLEVSGLEPGQAAMHVLSRKLTTIRRTFHDGGTRGILVVLKVKGAPIVRALDPRRLRTAFQVWCETEHWWVGMLVEWTGNVVRIDSCTFRVSHPAIPTASKSLFLLKGYERAERDLLKAHLDRSHAVIELGGSVGVVACVTNKLLRDPLKHVVVEANPDLISVLTGNRDRNGCEFHVLNRALAYGKDSTTFYVDTNFLASSVQIETNRAVQVPAVTLGGIIEEYGFDTCSLVCDIEGGELELVRHEPQVLQNHVSMIIVEIHWWRVGNEQGAEIVRTLERIGFRCLHDKDGTYVFRNERLHVAAEGTVAH